MLCMEVTVIENLPNITPGMDTEISKEFQKILTKQGIKFELNSKVSLIEDNGTNVKIEYLDNIKNESKNLVVDKALMAVGVRSVGAAKRGGCEAWGVGCSPPSSRR